MLHENDDPAGAVNQVHGAAHVPDHLAGDHPVGQVADRRYLHGTQDGGVDVAAADHAEAEGGVEEAGARLDRDGFLARIDQIGIDLVVVGVGADAEDPCSDCSMSVMSAARWLGIKVGSPMPRLTCWPLRNHVPRGGHGHGSEPSPTGPLPGMRPGQGPLAPTSTFFDGLARSLRGSEGHDPLDEHAGQVDLVWVELAGSKKCSTSAIVIRPAIAASGLKSRAAR